MSSFLVWLRFKFNDTSVNFSSKHRFLISREIEELSFTILLRIGLPFKIMSFLQAMCIFSNHGFKILVLTNISKKLRQCVSNALLQQFSLNQTR